MADLGVSPVSAGLGGLSDNPLKAADRILMKVALEGKSFQEARAEVRAERGFSEPFAPARAPVPADRVEFSAAALDILEVRAIHLEVHVERNGRTLDASLTSVSASALHVRTGRREEKPKDPLVLDLTGDGPRTTGAEGARAFDLAADGDSRGTSFVKDGTAFLALDRDGSGHIDSGAELFGDQHGAANGYLELAKFDANADGRIDAADPVYRGLQLLFGDGSTRSLAEAGIASLDLETTASDLTTSGGDTVFAQGRALLANGGSIASYALGLNRFDLQA